VIAVPTSDQPRHTVNIRIPSGPGTRAGFCGREAAKSSGVEDVELLVDPPHKWRGNNLKLDAVRGEDLIGTRVGAVDDALSRTQIRVSSVLAVLRTYIYVVACEKGDNS
jgi:hypothetical protein